MYTNTTPATLTSLPIPMHNDSGYSKCITINRNYTNIYQMAFGGIFHSLAFNIISLIGIILIFTVIRRKVGDYARLAVALKWTDKIHRRTPSNTERSVTVDKSEVKDDGYFTWIWTTIKLSDKDFEKKVGPECIPYLKFQKYLICLTVGLSLCSFFLLLPVNYFSGSNWSKHGFGKFTIINLGDSYALWVPIIFNVCSFAFIYVLTQHFIQNTSNKTRKKTRTIMITNFRSTKPNGSNISLDDLQTHFSESFDNTVKAVDLQLVFDVRKLTDLYKKMINAQSCLLYCDNYKRKTGNRLKMHPFYTGIMFCCCNEWEVDAESFYEGKESEYMEAIEIEEKFVHKNPIGIAFVVLENSEQAARIVEEFNWLEYPLMGLPRRTTLSRDLGVNDWKVRLAPPPDDIKWENLSIKKPYKLARWLLVHFLFLVLFLFLTTPAIGISFLDFFDRKIHLRDTIYRIPYVSAVAVPLIFVTIAAIIPFCILQISEIVGYHTTSKLNYESTVKVYVYLLFMVLILPSIGLTTASALLQMLITKQGRLNYYWECVFFPDNGAFFVNYVISASILGLMAEILRIADLIWYILSLFKMRSKAERRSVKKTNMLEFPYGFTSAFQLLVMSVVITYTPICPIIAPFGVLYTVMRHFVDKYNIYFSFAPSRINRDIHVFSCSVLLFSSILSLVTMLAFCWINQGSDSNKTIFMIPCVVGAVIIFFARKFFSCIRSLTPHGEFEPLDGDNSSEEGDSENDDALPQYLPKILLRNTATNSEFRPKLNRYGST